MDPVEAVAIFAQHADLVADVHQLPLGQGSISQIRSNARPVVRPHYGAMEGFRRVDSVALLLAAALGYAWWATSLRPFTSAALVATGAGAVAAVVAGLAMNGPVARRASLEQRPGRVVWLALVLALAAWELAAYFQLPRSEHPTLSSLANDLLRYHPVRALAMVAWLVLGARIVRR